uniref:Hypoxia inducible factor 1 subunit alpha, like n=1 Tax=Scophthalmus maximus TaxID=52904 RepID=A0A8D3C4N9_SCOMX
MEDKDDTVALVGGSSEQRKLRSRDAARCRRGQETEVFYELARTLPLPRRVSTQLDKAAIMRVVLSFLRMRSLLQDENQKEEEEEDPMDAFYPQTLAGFITVLTEEGDMIYLTENVSRHIGITQLELLGQSVYDFVHPCDQEELRDLLTPRPGLSMKSQKEQQIGRNFFLRMKSTLTSRGRTVNLKSATWKVLHCTGHMRRFGGSSTSPSAATVMTLLCEPIPHPSSVEFPLDTCTFLTRHSMDLRFTHCEGSVTELLGYKPDDLIGRSAYEFHHVLDSDHVNKSLLTLLAKGQVSTSHYRFLANSGGFVWAETQATVLYSSKTSQPEAVVCLNFILSAVEQPDVVFSVEQIRCGCLPKAEPHLPAPDCETPDSCDSDGDNLADSSRTEDACSKPSRAAELLFNPEEPEELFQLASAAGDAIIPLTGGFVELSFVSPPSPNSVPDHPQDLCTPQLRQLLTSIFSPVMPPASSSSPASSLDSDSVKIRHTEGMDLDMLAPYISMDDDFQLTVLSGLPEDADERLSDPSAATPAVTLRRKRAHNPDEMPSQMMSQDKRQKQAPSSTDEELLLSHGLLDCLEETDQLHLILDPGPGCRSRLLTNRDPILGGMQGLCETAALMRDIFIPCPPHLSPPLSPMT